MPHRLHHQLWSQVECSHQDRVQESEGCVLLRNNDQGKQNAVDRQTTKMSITKYQFQLKLHKIKGHVF